VRKAHRNAYTQSSCSSFKQCIFLKVFTYVSYRSGLNGPSEGRNCIHRFDYSIVRP
jgi:hypothetical protein